MRHGHYNINWFNGDVAPNFLDVVRQSEGTLVKIWNIQTKFARMLSFFSAFGVHKKVILLKAKFFQVDNSQLKDGSIWN